MKKASEANRGFYADKRVFVTGHTGFKGAWLTQILHVLGVSAYGYALPAVSGSLFDKINGETLIGHATGDIREKYKLADAVVPFKPEIIFHLAAQAIVQDCYENPYKAYGTNVMGAVNLFEVIRMCPSVKSVVIVTSDKVYENKGDGAVYKVGDPLGGTDPYSASKTCVEFISESYKSSYLQTDKRTVGVATVRASNVIGGGDHVESRLIPSILNGFANEKPVELRNAEQTRPWQSVLDALNGYLTVGLKLYNEPLTFSSPWNIGPVKEGICSVGDVFEKMRMYFESSAPYTIAEKFAVKESKTLGLDIAESVDRLEWSPEMPLDKTLYHLTDFYKRHQQGESDYSICTGQIRDYYAM